MLSVTTVGEGQRPLVLLHGFLGSGRNLRTLAQRLVSTGDYRALLVDLPGHGESGPPSAGESLRSMARKVAEATGSGEMIWIGHSLGGRVALAAVDAVPERVSRVAMLDISPSTIATERSASGEVLKRLLRAPQSAPDRAAMRSALVAEEIDPSLVDWLMTNLKAVDGGVRWRFDRAALDVLHRRVNEEDLWSVVEARARPLLCVRGARSRYVSTREQERMSSLGVAVETVNADHFVHVEALDALVAILAKFCAS